VYTSLCASQNDFTVQPKNAQPHEKIYLDLTAIEIQDGKITICNEDRRVNVKALFSDENGLYILANSVRITPMWICMECSRTYRQSFPPTKCEGCPGRDFIVRYPAER